MSFTKTILSKTVKSTRYHFHRSLHLSPVIPHRAYDAEGKTRVDILDAQRLPDCGLLVDTYSQVGFRLSNKVTVMGPIILFSRSVLSWNVSGPYDITAESLSLFYKLEPKLDILVLGIGDSLERRELISKSIRNELVLKNKINVEILTTDNACATYNFLCTEHRLCAGAFIPPKSIHVNEQDIIDAKRRRCDLYESVMDDDKEGDVEVNLIGALGKKPEKKKSDSETSPGTEKKS